MSDIAISRELAGELDRRAVEEFAMPSVLLMENAGRGVVDWLGELGIDGPVAVCCGRGNNGGDGFVVARHLDLRHHRVCVLLFADPAELRGDAAIQYRILEASGVRIVRPATEELQRHLTGSAWVVDALLGTGARGEPRPPLNLAIDRINGCGARIMAVDLPSGLDADTGITATTTIRATHTCTFVALKAGFLAPGAADYLGTVRVVDIGAPRKLVDAILARGTLVRRD
jgi:NAD(P)H-hydrate epimerase